MTGHFYCKILPNNVWWFPVVATMVLLAASPTKAQTPYYWGGGTGDIPNGTVVAGGAGTWNTTIKNWATSTAGTSYGEWVNANLGTAVFGGTAGAVTLGANIDVGGLTFNTTGYGVTSTGFTLNFAAANNTILLNNIAAATITGPVGGTGNVILKPSNPATAGTLTLNGTSTGGWSGTTTIHAGTTLALTGLNQGLRNSSGITLNGGFIALTNTSGSAVENDRVSSAAITSNGGTLTLTNSANAGIYAEAIGSVSLNSGLTTFLFTQNAGTGNQTLTLGGLTRTGAGNTSSVLFASNSGLSPTKNIMVVSGATATTGGQIIGAWATTGNTGGAGFNGASNDYAVFDGSGRVLPAGIAATAQTLWTMPANAYSLGGSTTLTATRTITALRNTGATATLTLATEFNLETYGVLNGAGTLFTVAATGTGALTTPTGGGNIHINAGNGTTGGPISVSTPLNDNGTVTLVKDGIGTLTLGSTTSNYSGGTVLNSGTLATTADANLGIGGGVTVNGIATWNLGGATAVDYNRTLTVNDGAVLSFVSGNAAKTISGVVSGNGALVWNVTTDLILSNTGNTFNGPITVTTGGTNPYGFSPSSLGDDPGAGAVNLGGATSTGYFYWYGSAKTFDDRQFALSGTTGGGVIDNRGSGALVITKDLGINGVGAKILTLAGTNTGDNTFAGNIANGTGSVIGLTKSGAVTWILSGANTYTGPTLVNGGTLTAASTGGSALGSTSGITIATSGTLALGASNQINNSASVTLSGGTLSLGGSYSEGVAGTSGLGDLNHTATSTLDFGTIGNSSSIQFGSVTHTAGVGILNVTNYESGTDHLYFSGTASSFSSVYNQADVTFNGTSGYTLTQSSGFYEVSPVPEPGTVLGLAAAGMGIAGWVSRRRVVRA